MAFTAAPASGTPPYVLSVIFDDTTFIDGVNYRIDAKYSSAKGSCPVQGVTTSFSSKQLNTLLSTGSATLGVSVLPGECRTYTLQILRVRNSKVIASSNTYVNNV